MVRASVVQLMTESPEAHGVYDERTETPRKVYCAVRSVGMRENYEALSHGLHPETVLILSHSFEYKGEKWCTFEGRDFDIIRTYVTESDGVELTLQRRML